MSIARILRIREVEHVTGLSQATIYRKMADKTFPAQVRLAARTVGWHEADIQQWIESLTPQVAPEAEAA